MTTRNSTIPAKPAAGYWTDTGLTLNLGDVVTITADASDRWALGGRWPGKAGADGFGFDDYRKQYGQGHLKPGPLASAPHAMLVGQIGGGTDAFSPLGVFEVGSSHTFTAGSAGKLYLTCNDDAFNGNSGSIDVTIKVTAASHGVKKMADVKTPDKSVNVYLWDYQQQDGDSVVVYLNGSAVIGSDSSPAVLKNKALAYPVDLKPGRNTLRMVTKSEGSSGACTGKLKITAGSSELLGWTQFSGKVGDEVLVNLDVTP